MSVRRRAAIASAVGAAATAAAVAVAIAGAGGGAYAIRMATPAPLAPGKRGTISFAIAPGPGHAISQDGPIAIAMSVTPRRGLALPKRRYRRADAADPRARAPRFDLAVRGGSPGSYRVGIVARFWVCAKRSCRPITARRSATVKVVAPPADAGAAAADAAPAG